MKNIALLNRLIFIFKIVSALSVLIVMMPNEKFIIPVWLWLFLCVSGIAGSNGMLLGGLVVAAVVYVLIFAHKNNALNDWLCVGAILIFYIPVGLAMPDIFKRHVFVSWLTAAIFVATSVAAFGLIITRLIKGRIKYPE